MPLLDPRRADAVGPGRWSGATRLRGPTDRPALAYVWADEPIRTGNILTKTKRREGMQAQMMPTLISMVDQLVTS